MERESGFWRSQLKGYLFEIIISELLAKNNFSRITPALQPNDRVREIRPGFIEIKGRGCWHQIDCPCEYKHHIPFSYPIRLLGEVKFYKSPLEKKHIREYIGVMKDIQENYYVTDGTTLEDHYPRKLDIGVYFSANGFQAEAEKLAYAHGIKTVSYDNNYLVSRLKSLIELLEEKYLSVNCMKGRVWNDFRSEFVRLVSFEGKNEKDDHWGYWNEGYMAVIGEIRSTLLSIKTSFIATTATGVFLHFVGIDCFPEELFRHSDEGSCCVHYDRWLDGSLRFWLEITGDEKHSRFYFTPPKSLDRAALYGQASVLEEKEVLFRVLNVNIQMEEITRNLVLRLDEDWLDVAHSM